MNFSMLVDLLMKYTKMMPPQIMIKFMQASVKFRVTEQTTNKKK